MNTIAELIWMHGGFGRLMRDYIRIESPSSGIMRLVIEHLGKGPREGELISVAHYYDQNGDAMKDPEMVIEVNAPADGVCKPKEYVFAPVHFEMSSPPIYKRACWTEDNKILINAFQIKDQKAFMRAWDRNLKAQGFLDAYRRQYVGLLYVMMERDILADLDAAELNDLEA